MNTKLGFQLQAKLIEQAIELARRGQYVESAQKFEQSDADESGIQTESSLIAFAFYRRALLYLANMDLQDAIRHLETANRFPGVPNRLRSLFQERISAIRKDPSSEIREFDAAIADRFESRPTSIDLRAEFLRKYTLSQARRKRTIPKIDAVSAVGVYRWAGDINRNETWSELIRAFKQGDQGLPAFFGRILAEHVRTSETCKDWICEVDYIVPVPASSQRIAQRGADIVTKMGDHLSSRLKIPIRTDFLRRGENSERSRDVHKAHLASQYTFNHKKELNIKDRVILLLDDVMTRGHTAEVCASRLREGGCSKVFLLVLALAESTLQSNRHSDT